MFFNCVLTTFFGARALRVHPSIFRASKLHWQVPVIFLFLLGFLIFNIFYFGKLQKQYQAKQSQLLEVAVLNQQFDQGQEIHKTMVSLMKVDPAYLPENYITNQNNLIGCKTLGPVPAKYPLTPIMISGDCKAVKQNKKEA